MTSPLGPYVEYYILNKAFFFFQCEKEYHVGCLKKCKLADLKVSTSAEGSYYALNSFTCL